jgi:hypothetical protein
MASKKFYVDLDLFNNQLLNARIQNLVTDPAVFPAGSEALFWYNTTEQVLKYYNGTAVVTLAQGGDMSAAIAQVLSDAKAYTDNAVSTAQTALQGSINSLAQNLSDGDAATLTAAQSYTDTQLAASESATNAAIASAIAQEVIDRDAAVTSAIAQEVINRDSAITIAINQEVTYRTLADADTLVSANSYTDSVVIGINTTVSDLTADLAQEISDRTAQDGILSAAITQEATDRNQGDSDTLSAAMNYADGVVGTESALRVQGDADTLAAAQSYADSLIGNLSGTFRGDYDASTGSVPVGTTAKAGDYWRVSVAGTLTGLTPNPELEVGDIIAARIANPLVAADFFSLQGNISGAVTSSESVVADGELAVFDGTTGKVIKGSGVTSEDLSQMSKTFDIQVNLTAGVSSTIVLAPKSGLEMSNAATRSTVTVIDSADGDEVFIKVVRTNNNIVLSSNVTFVANVTINTPYTVGSISILV